MPVPNNFQTDYFLALGFTKSCSSFPVHHALFINGCHYTYQDLLAKAETVFAQLNKKDLPAYIGIYTGESVWTYAAILAISMSGAGYVPLNPKLPDQKLQNIITSVDLKLILTENKISFAHNAVELIIDTKSTEGQKTKIVQRQDVAYVLFTSGTTGEPKGVPVSKKNCFAFFEHFAKNFDFNQNDKFLQPYELSFDVSVFSIFAAWNCGACVYVVPDEGFKYLNCMTMIKAFGITVSSMVPTVLQYIEKYLPAFSFPDLKYSFFSGDKLYQHLAGKWKNAAVNSRIYNCYGPTETTIVCTAYLWDENLSKNESVNNIVPLGKPFEGMEIILVNDKDEIVDNEIGELCLSGAQVIAAYFNQKFENSFLMLDGKRFYKTGDLVEINKNGNLIFHGRKDTQVKINGFRVEPAEIENAIFGLTGKNSVVISKSVNNMEVLFAFLESSPTDETQLAEQLSVVLPRYMIPAHYKFIEGFPTNMNGKIDRQQLKNTLNE